MTGSNTSLRRVRALYFYSQFSGSRARSSWPSFASKLVSAFPPTWRRLLSWAGLLRVTALGIGLAYATISMLGEYHYATALRQPDLGSALAHLLAPLITIELAMGRDADAKAHYQIFKQVAKSSPLNGLVH